VTPLLVYYMLQAPASAAAPPPENRTVIAVVDTGVDTKDKHIAKYLCRNGGYDATNTSIHDVHGHGTHITGLLVNGLDVTKYCVYPIKYFHRSTSPLVIGRVLTRMAKLKPRYVNFSSSGPGAYPTELATYKSLLASGSTIYVAAGNDSLDLDTACIVTPACLKPILNHPNFHVISNFSSFSNYATFTEPGPSCGNYNGDVMCGTSQSTAIMLNKLLRSK